MRYIFGGGNITVQSSDSLIWVFLFVNTDIFTNLIYQKKTQHIS